MRSRKLHLILGGAALQRCCNCTILNAPSQFAEKLTLRIRASFSDAVSSLKSGTPLGAGHRKLGFSANCSAAEVTVLARERLFPQPV
jgi:hypothetical protein